MYLSTARPWFSFLVHPRDIRDLDTIRAASLLRRYSDTEQEYVAKACTLPPLVLGDVRVRGEQVLGEVVCAVRMPEQMMLAEGMTAVVESALLAVQRGTALIGLGALTAPAMGGGTRLLRHLPAQVKVTNGNGYTAAVTRDNVREAIDYLGLGGRPRVAVVGSTGSVGGAASRLLAEEDIDLVLLGRTEQRVRHLLGDLEGRATLTADLDVVKTADVVVTLTHDRTAELTPERLTPDTVVIDVAAPYNIAPSRRPEFAQAGIAVVKGGLAHIPGFRCVHDFDLPAAEDTFACLAETYLMAREGLFENSVGRPTADYARRMSELATRYGVRSRSIAGDIDRAIGAASKEI
ncbi:NAD(P)-binding domain-containing protein [Micromonospora sp. NPDC049044]|uniref:NAD(P)-binding domain-containing protein n=1 Tax=unclassified Micromonospora TaxID=2617518 RepID=UPI0033FD5064